MWVLLYNVPVEYWTPKGLSYISSAIGKPLFADSTTLSRRRLNYARVCVEIEASAKLIEEFDLATGLSEDPYINPIRIKALYQWKPASCTHCQTFGHTTESCKANPTPPTNFDPKGKVVAASDVQQPQMWAQVGRKARAGRSGGSSNRYSRTTGDVSGLPTSATPTNSKCWERLRMELNLL